MPLPSTLPMKCSYLERDADNCSTNEGSASSIIFFCWPNKKGALVGSLLSPFAFDCLKGLLLYLPSCCPVRCKRWGDMKHELGTLSRLKKAWWGGGSSSKSLLFLWCLAWAILFKRSEIWNTDRGAPSCIELTPREDRKRSNFKSSSPSSPASFLNHHITYTQPSPPLGFLSCTYCC